MILFFYIQFINNNTHYRKDLQITVLILSDVIVWKAKYDQQSVFKPLKAMQITQNIQHLITPVSLLYKRKFSCNQRLLERRLIKARSLCGVQLDVDGPLTVTVLLKHSCILKSTVVSGKDRLEIQSNLFSPSMINNSSDACLVAVSVIKNVALLKFRKLIFLYLHYKLFIPLTPCSEKFLGLDSEPQSRLSDDVAKC